MPSGLPDRWYARKDEPAMQNALRLWERTGDKWALPQEYTAENSWTINKTKRYLGEELVEEANAMYAAEFERLMDGKDIDAMNSEEMNKLIEKLKDIDTAIDKAMKARIQKARG